MDNTDLISKRILLLGDSGVGKSVFRKWLCKKPDVFNTIPTVGCDVDVMVKYIV